jgi:hypothetical protein
MGESLLEGHLADVTEPEMVCQDTLNHNIMDKACAFTHALTYTLFACVLMHSECFNIKQTT